MCVDVGNCVLVCLHVTCLVNVRAVVACERQYGNLVVFDDV